MKGFQLWYAENKSDLSQKEGTDDETHIQSIGLQVNLTFSCPDRHKQLNRNFITVFMLIMAKKLFTNNMFMFSNGRQWRKPRKKNIKRHASQEFLTYLEEKESVRRQN